MTSEAFRASEEVKSAERAAAAKDYKKAFFYQKQYSMWLVQISQLKIIFYFGGLKCYLLHMGDVRSKSAERVAVARGYLITLTSKDYQKQHLITGSTFTNSNIGSSKVQAEYMPIVPSASYASRKCLSKSRLKNSRRPEQICRAATNQKKSNRISISSRRNI